MRRRSIEMIYMGAASIWGAPGATNATTAIKAATELYDLTIGAAEEAAEAERAKEAEARETEQARRVAEDVEGMEQLSAVAPKKTADAPVIEKATVETEDYTGPDRRLEDTGSNPDGSEDRRKPAEQEEF